MNLLEGGEPGGSQLAGRSPGTQRNPDFSNLPRNESSFEKSEVPREVRSIIALFN